MEDVAKDEVGLYQDYKDNYSEDTLKRDSALNSVVKEALLDPFHLCMSFLVFCICRAAGTTCQIILSASHCRPPRMAAQKMIRKKTDGLT